MDILALDLGNKTGVAWSFGNIFGAETRTLASAKEIAAWGRDRQTRRCDPRIPRLFRYLRDFSIPEVVVFEDVEFSTYTKQTQLWSSFRTAVWLAFDGKAVIECVPVTTLKKFATGSGAADKEQMKCALKKQYQEINTALDDNAIDAIWILKWAEKNLSRLKV